MLNIFLFLLGCNWFKETTSTKFNDDEIQLYQQDYPKGFKKKVLIDPGHGCTDTGAKGVDLIEKDSNWSLAQAVVKHLNSTGKYKASLTRKSKDSGCQDKVWKRGRLADNQNSDVLISLHADGPASDLEGSWIIWSNQKMAKKSWQDNNLLADLLGASLQESGFKLFNMKAHYNALTANSKIKYLTTNDRYGVHIDHNKGLAILRNTSKPAVLIETYWLQNPKEATLFAKPATQQKYAKAIEKALLSFFATKYELYNPKDKVTDSYTVQVYASGNRGEVENFVRPLIKSLSLTENDYSITEFKRGTETWFRLRIGRFASVEDAETYTEKLESQKIKEYWITPR
jgi:N-acetylmuramoyl-L-alanine amidase